MVFAGIDFYRLRKWAWWFAVAVISVLAAWVCGMCIDFLLRAHGVKPASIESALIFLVCYPFLVYYLVRSRTRIRFGIGSSPTKTDSYPRSG